MVRWNLNRFGQRLNKERAITVHRKMEQHTGRIVRDLMDEPHVEGHRVSVRRIHTLVEERGVEPRAVADSLGLNIADVYRALAYYHENPGEMREAEDRRKRRIERSHEEDGVIGPNSL